jgi:hypothetical protein
MNFSNEPYICGEAVEGAAPLFPASWTSKRYLGYADRTVRMEYRLTDGPDSAWDNRFRPDAGRTTVSKKRSHRVRHMPEVWETIMQ